MTWDDRWRGHEQSTSPIWVGGRADATWDKRLRAWARPAVLICDDFGLRELTPAPADDLYELRERIYQGTVDVASIRLWRRDPVS